MAEAKKKPGRPPGSKNKNSSTAAASKSSKSTKGNQSKAKAKAQEIQSKRKAEKRVIDEIWAIIAIAIGAFLIFATFTDGAGQFGELLGAALKGLLGFIAYVLPFYIILYGVMLFAKKTVHISFKSTALIILALIMLTIMNSVRFIDEKSVELTWTIMKEFYGSGVALESGGFFGMTLATLLIKWFGKPGCWIFALVVLFSSLLLLINTPVSRFVSNILDKMEERKLTKEHAHLDYVSEEEQGVQVTMEQLAKEKKGFFGGRKKDVKNQDLMSETTVVKSGEQKILPPLKQELIPQENKLKIVGPGLNLEDEMPVAEMEPVKRSHVPPSQIEPLTPEKKNSILKYMNDDSLFGRKNSSGSMGLEDKADYGVGYGLDGGVSSSKASVTATAGGQMTMTGLGNEINSTMERKTSSATEGTPAAQVQQKITNKEAREAMLTEEELKQAEKPIIVYQKPPIELLNKSDGVTKANGRALQAKAMKLEETLKNFHVNARVVQVTQGPTVTRYEIQPDVGVKVSSIVRLADDIALNLEAKSIRIEAPIPGKAAVGIEVENDAVSMVKLRDIIDSKAFEESKSKITFSVGKDISGNAIVADLKSMPHLLIAGSTGSGKSVCINSIILSLLYKATPDEVKLILVDPKVVELGNYNGIPHLMIPVVTEPTKAAAALNWAVAEMTDRYKKFAETGVRDLESYNEAMRADGDDEKVMPQIVIIIDELADLMMAAPSQIEESICRLAQMARAAGMHLIVATQRPSVDVITGVIKANIPSRIAFAVSSQVDSRTILDMQGAEKLVGKGDMLFNPMGMGKPIRVQGTFVSDSEVHKVIDFVKSQVEEGATRYNEEVLTRIERTNVDSMDDGDDLLPEAIDLVVRSGQASVSMLQRRFRIGYNRAARIVDIMEARGIVGPQDGSRPRQVLMTEEELDALENDTADV